jgi:hypothetical protein
MFDFATLVNRSNRFIDKAVVEEAGVAGVDAKVLRGMKDDVDVGAKASVDAIEATMRRAVRKFIIIGLRG